MSEVMIAEKVGEVVWNFLKPFIVFIVCALVGVALMWAWDRSGPRPAIHVFAWTWSPFGQSLKTERDTARTSLAAATKAQQQTWAWGSSWKTADDMCEATRVDENSAAANQVNTAFGQKQTGSDSSFNNGYAAGKALCGDPHAPIKTAPAVVGGAQPGGMRISPADADVGQLFAAGAYKAR